MQLIAAPLYQATEFYPAGGESSALGQRMPEADEPQGWKKTPSQALESPSTGNRARVHILPAHIPKAFIPKLRCRWKSGYQATPDLQEHHVLAPETKKVMEIHFLSLRVRALKAAKT